MNIAYSLKLLGHDVIPFVFVGNDLDSDYQAHLNSLKLDQSGIILSNSVDYSSKCFIFSDPDGNQFTGFYPGPSRNPEFSKRLENFADQTFDYAIIAPDIPENMIATAQVLRQKSIPFLSDPGQGITDFKPIQAELFISKSEELIVNRFEHHTLSKMTNLDRLKTLIVTDGQDETQWYGNDSGTEKTIPPQVFRDPTGCGDAFRAGWLHAKVSGASTRDSVRLGTVLATIAMESSGSQKHTVRHLNDYYLSAWGELPLFLHSPQYTK